VKPLRLWLPVNGGEQELIIPGAQVAIIAGPGGFHEAGHIVAAHHLGARVFGIALGAQPQRSERQMFLLSIYGWRGVPKEATCIAKAAGPAADFLFGGEINAMSAGGDLADIEVLTGISSFEPFLSQASKIVSDYYSAVLRIAEAVRRSVAERNEHWIGELPNGELGAMLVDEDELMRCLTTIA
jgi:hypothetical protein